MDYKYDDVEDIFPKRTDDVYKKIEKYEPYELTHCIVFEMAVRNKDVKEILSKLKMIKSLQDAVMKFNNDIDEFIVGKNREHKIIYENLIGELKDRYYLYYDQSAINIPQIENPFKKAIVGMSIEEYEEELSDAFKSPIMKHLSSIIGEYLSEDERNSYYKSNHNIYNGFTIAQGIDRNSDTFNISSINTHFQRKIYDTNQINISLNMSLSEDEILAYIKHIKNTLEKDDDNGLKTPNALLGKDTEGATKTTNYPKKQNAIKLADMFFVYDYVTDKLTENEDSIKLIEEEYNENKNNVKNSSSYTTKEKNIQYQVLKDEYEENKTTVNIEKIFNDFNTPSENINFKSSTASNYYYALKPYIEECRYPEFLTGESIIEDEEYLEK